jgi:hypothetical protein
MDAGDDLDRDDRCDRPINHEGCSQARAHRLRKTGDAHGVAGATLKLNIIPLS